MGGSGYGGDVMLAGGEPSRTPATLPANAFWLIGMFETTGEVMFAGDEPADKPSLQAHAAPKSGLRPTSPSASKLAKSRMA
jgi:hypothetical protein